MLGAATVFVVAGVLSVFEVIACSVFGACFGAKNACQPNKTTAESETAKNNLFCSEAN